ncbi:MAG: hypothetical protein U0176_08155 [Bacteroidia bacterium]
MKTFALQHSFTEAQCAALWEAAPDFSKLGSYHPLMKKVVELEPEAGGKRWFKVWEEVSIRSWWKMRPVYKVRTEVLEPHRQVAYHARIMGLIRLQITITLGPTEANQVFRVAEQVQVTQLPIATRLFTQVFIPAHQALFQNLRTKH